MVRCGSNNDDGIVGFNEAIIVITSHKKLYFGKTMYALAIENVPTKGFIARYREGLGELGKNLYQPRDGTLLWPPHGLPPSRWRGYTDFLLE